MVHGVTWQKLKEIAFDLAPLIMVNLPVYVVNPSTKLLYLMDDMLAVLTLCYYLRI